MAGLSGLEVHAWRHVYAANLVGGALVTTYLVVSSPESRASWVSAAVGFGLLAALMALSSRWHTNRIFASTRVWVSADRAPTGHERAVALRIPDRVALLTLAYWIVIAAGQGSIMTVLGLASGARIGATVASTLVAGVAASVLSHVVAERDLRPVFAAALRSSPPERTRIFGSVADSCCSGPWAQGSPWWGSCCHRWRLIPRRPPLSGR